jgi:hypothetical protein
MADSKPLVEGTGSEKIDEIVAKYLSENPHLADALATFGVAQEEYRKSLLALDFLKVVTTGSANLQA